MPLHFIYFDEWFDPKLKIIQLVFEKGIEMALK